MMKEYKNMTQQEQAQWIKQFSEFLANDYANVKAMGEGWRQAFERGLKVLSPMTICVRFVKDARTYMDYERRIQRMAFFIEELRKQVVSVDGKLLASVTSAPQKRRVGRPTKQEAAAYRHEQALKESGKVDAIAQVAGLTPIAQVGDLFEQPAQQPTNPTKPITPIQPVQSKEPTPQTLNSQPSTLNASKSYHLQDIKHLLSGDLQSAVDSIAILRSEAATCSEQAKEAAMEGKPQEEIEKYATLAGQKTEAYENIYRAIDEDLAKKYIRARMCKEDSIEGNKVADVLEITQSYYQKITASDPAFEGKYLAHLASLKEKEERERKQGMTDKDKKKFLKGIRDYFLRKDMKPSEARLKKLEEKMQQAFALGENIEEYQLIYKSEKKIVEDLQNS